MASLYDAGYGGDQAAAGRGQALAVPMNQAVPNEVSPYAKMQKQMTAGGTAGGGRAADDEETRRRRAAAGAQNEMTFRQMQGAGVARPAPPPAQQPMQPMQPEQQMQRMPRGQQPVLQYAPPPDQRQQAMQAAQQAYAPQQQVNQAQQQMVNLRQMGGQQPVLTQAPARALQQAYPQAQQQMQMGQGDPFYQNWLQSMQGTVDPRRVGQFEAHSQMLRQASANRTPETNALMQQAQAMGMDPMAVLMDPQGFQQQLAQGRGQQPVLYGGGGVGGAIVPQPPQQQDLATPMDQSTMYGNEDVWRSGGDMPLANVPMTPQPSVQGMPRGQQPVLYGADDTWRSGGDMPQSNVPTGVAPYAQPMQPQAPTEQVNPPMPVYQAQPPMQQPMQQQAPGATPGAPAVGTMPQFTGDINAYLGQALNNPGGYSFDETKKLYERLGQNIDDDFSQRNVALREEMAARGLSDSSIQGGRLADLNVGRRSAQQDLLQGLGSQQAQALFGQQTGFLDRLLGLRGQDQTAAYQQGQLGLGQGELNRGLMNDQDRLMLQLLGVGDF